MATGGNANDLARLAAFEDSIVIDTPAIFDNQGRRAHGIDRTGTRVSARDRGMILVVVLVMVVLLSLLAAAYSFMVRANLRTVMASHHQFQARMAAESAIQRAIVILRESRGNTDAWYNNPQEFRGGLVEGTTGSDVYIEPTEDGRYDPNADPAWRFNLVGRDNDNPDGVRYGLTDEGARLYLNSATDEQLTTLFSAVIPQDTERETDVNVLVDSLLDWREPGVGPRPNGAKDEYYQSLEPPYRCKKAPFATIEELLLVRGFSGWVVFGEDYNRNGLLDPNENDGDRTFPPDNEDGALFRGIAPYLTLWSREMNMSGDGRPRINLNLQDTQKLQEQLSEEFDGDIVSYVMQVRGSGAAFNSVMNLIPAPPLPEPEIPESQPADPAQIELSPTSQPVEGESTGNSQTLTEQPADGRQFRRGSGNTRGNRPTQAQQPGMADLTPDPPPGDYADLPLILDRLTVNPAPGFIGRINVNTAPREVLLTIPGLSVEQVDAIVAARTGIRSEDKTTPAWLLTQAGLDEPTFRRILDQITTSASAFRAEAVGYADHLGVVHRSETVFEMRGPIAQVLYYRDLNGLGFAYTPHGEETRGLSERSN